MNIDIFGSCVTRDAFNFDSEKKYEINSYYARSSLVSLYAAPLDIDEDSIRLDSPFQRRIVAYDLNKSFLKYIQTGMNREPKPFLIIDFIDERFDVIATRTPIDGFITRSEEWVNANMGNIAFQGVSALEKMSLWNRAVVRFANDIKKNYSENRIIIHKAYWQEKYVSVDGKISEFDNPTYIQKNNEILHNYYETMVQLLPEAHIIELQDYIANEKHIWGLTPFHYQDEYYRHFLRKLDTIMLMGGEMVVEQMEQPNEINEAPQTARKRLMERPPLLSVIMPVYNAQDTVGRAIRSALDTPRQYEIEVVVVDDCSSDDTVAKVEELQKKYKSISLYKMPQNSGGPSAPRNLGIEKAKGEYVTFLDDDDWVDADRMLSMAEYAKYKELDFLKGYLCVVQNDERTLQNRLPTMPTSSEETLKMMIAFQSTTQDFLVRRAILLDHNLRYQEDLKIGEDTVFVLSVLVQCKSIAYVDNYYLYYDKTSADILKASSTQQCDDREVNSQLDSWERAEKVLSGTKLSYYALRLHVGFRNLLLSIVRFSQGISEETYFRMHNFAVQTKQKINGKMNLHKRYEELYQAILAGDYQAYLITAKRRLLVAGYDLKFITPVIPYLGEDFQVKVDEWTGHDAHDKSQSRDCCDWADIIWCEWLLGNAVYYSQHKNANQRMIIRAHRFELGREFGMQIDYTKVDMVITVGYYYFEQFAAKFSVPRSKMRLLPNYVEDVIYSADKSPDAKYHIGLVGILPARKGFHRGLELLLKLRAKDERFKLYIMGQSPQEVSWIKNNPEEADYFRACEDYIKDNNLSEAVIFGGYRPREELYNDIGYVLSLSDPEFPESFHLAPAEGACAGSMGLLLRWPGVEYIYPADVVFDSLDEIAGEIEKASGDDSYYYERAAALRTFVLDAYRIDRFLETLGRYFKQLYLL